MSLGYVRIILAKTSMFFKVIIPGFNAMFYNSNIFAGVL
jgi:hypothetical protein